ncbi:hypothetical protein EDB83DRAFT_2369437, partial [Lactarius deliciosus]
VLHRISYHWNAPFGSPAGMPPKLFLGDLSWNMILPFFPGSWVRHTVCAPSHLSRAFASHTRHLRVRIMHSRTLREGLMGLICEVMLVVSSVQFSLATEHAMPLLVQSIRVFTGTVGSPDGPSLIDHECASLTEFKIPHHKRTDRLSFTVINASLIGDAVLIWRLWMIGAATFASGGKATNHRLHFSCRPCHWNLSQRIPSSSRNWRATWLTWLRSRYCPISRD